MQTGGDNRRQFASDNWAGICPEALAALAGANQGHAAASYGEDPWTGEAAGLIRDVFETPCEVFFVFTGTAANALSLASLCEPHHSILCHEHAHIETGECGAAQLFTRGAKLRLLPGANGKIDAATVARAAEHHDFHSSKPRVLSLTQGTEAGTIYSVAEIKALTDLARRSGLHVHMDGARFANAVAALGVAPREITWQAGVDVLSFGCTKNGIAAGEAVVFFNTELAGEFEYRCKQAAQLASKMRFITAQWAGLLRDGAWLRHAAHANAMAARLAAALQVAPRVKLAFPCQTNAVFVEMPRPVIEALWERGWKFYTFADPTQCRLMCAWDTMAEDVDALAADVKSLVS